MAPMASIAAVLGAGPVMAIRADTGMRSRAGRLTQRQVRHASRRAVIRQPSDAPMTHRGAESPPRHRPVTEPVTETGTVTRRRADVSAFRGTQRDGDQRQIQIAFSVQVFRDKVQVGRRYDSPRKSGTVL